MTARIIPIRRADAPLASDDMRDKAALWRAMADDFDAIDRIEPRFANIRTGGNMPRRDWSGPVLAVVIAAVVGLFLWIGLAPEHAFGVIVGEL